MHIGIVGGVERGEQRYAAAAASRGHSFEFHGGDMAGRGSDSLEALVERSDFDLRDRRQQPRGSARSATPRPRAGETFCSRAAWVCRDFGRCWSRSTRPSTARGSTRIALEQVPEFQIAGDDTGVRHLQTMRAFV